jgi:uncharacterized repeat protein (TIGR01451 family)
MPRFAECGDVKKRRREMNANPSRLMLIAAVVFLSTVGAPNAHPSAADAPVVEEEGESTLQFVENVGQFDGCARFQALGGPATTWLSEDAIWISLAERTAPAGHPSAPAHQPGDPTITHVKLRFVDANPHPRVAPFDRRDTLVHYYRGNDPSEWHTDVPVWGGVRYVGLYPGIDLIVGDGSAPLPWRLEAREGADLSAVRLRVAGSETVRADNGALHLTTAAGELTLPLPTLTAAGDAVAGEPTISALAGDRFDVAHPFASSASISHARAALASQDDGPTGLAFGTFLGGGLDDSVADFAPGHDGASYLTGYTDSVDFPDAGGAPSGGYDAFVAKLSADGSTLVYTTFLGGSYEDGIFDEFGQGIAVDDAGAAYVTGATASADFPTTSGAFDTTYNGPEEYPGTSPPRQGYDAFVVKLDGSGALTYGTYLGGSSYDAYSTPLGGDDEGTAIGVKDGIVYVAGQTDSWHFPTTSDAYDGTYAGVDHAMEADVFVAKINPAGNGESDLAYGTFVGEAGPEASRDLAVDGGGMVYVAGSRGTAGMVFKLDPGDDGSSALHYLMDDLKGGYPLDGGYGIAVDTAGSAYVTGKTTSPDFPTTPDAYDTTCGTDGTCDEDSVGAYRDAFLVRLDPDGNRVYATFLGDSSIDEGHAIGLDSEGHVYVVGMTGSSDFPITPDAYDGTPVGNEVFVTRWDLDEAGADGLVYSTYLGGTGSDGPTWPLDGMGVSVTEGGTVTVGGPTESPDFPTTPEAYDPTYNREIDAFVVRLEPLSPDLSPSTKGVSPEDATVGEVVTYTVQLVNRGTVSTTVTVTDTLPGTLRIQGSPTTSSGGAPVATADTVTWSGTVTDGATVTLTYAAELTSTTTLTPSAVNEAEIDDGAGTVYVRRAFLNGHRIFLPLVLK